MGSVEIFTPTFLSKLGDKLSRGREDWNYFAREIMGINLDREQQAILESVQFNRMTSAVSGTSRGKDYVSAAAALCFLYNTPRFDRQGNLVANTKIGLTAPTGRQIDNIMMPEIARIYRSMVKRGFGFLAGTLTSSGVKTAFEEWFLTAFKADEHNLESWTGFHASNVMFAITEATGIKDPTFDAIEGNLQGNSRLLLVFNFNRTTGYAAKSQSSPRWKKFRLNSMNAINVIEKRIIIPGQVDYDWIKDKVETWCTRVDKDQVNEGDGDFEFEGYWYKPNDLFRIKVQGLPPNEAPDTLIPRHWIELANERWKSFNGQKNRVLRLGVDVAGMGRDTSCFCPRYDNYVEKFETVHSGGIANHTAIAGKTKNYIVSNTDRGTRREVHAMIDTIGEGAGVYSMLVEAKAKYVYSCKFSEAAEDNNGKPLKDVTDVHEFANMRAYLFWAIRDWLDPSKGSKAMLPPDDHFLEEAVEIKYKFLSNGKILIEGKDDIKKRLGRSTDKFDSLANTFYPFNSHKGKRIRSLGI